MIIAVIEKYFPIIRYRPTQGNSGVSKALGCRKNLALITSSAICPGRQSCPFGSNNGRDLLEGKKDNS